MNKTLGQFLTKPAKKWLDGLEHVPGESCSTRIFSFSNNPPYMDIWPYTADYLKKFDLNIF